jgi:hypothetical protein
MQLTVPLPALFQNFLPEIYFFHILHNALLFDNVTHSNDNIKPVPAYEKSGKLHNANIRAPIRRIDKSDKAYNLFYFGKE